MKSAPGPAGSGPWNGPIAAATGAFVLFLLFSAPFLIAGKGLDWRWLTPVAFQAGWCFAEASTVARFRQGRNPGRSGMGLARLISGVSFAMAAVSLGECLWTWDHPGAEFFWTAVFGTSIGVAGVALRLSAIRTLGERFRDDIDLGSDHPIETGGPYAWCRHPGELGFLLAMLGLAVLFRSAIGLSLLFLLLAPLSLWRISRENRLLGRTVSPGLANSRGGLVRRTPGGPAINTPRPCRHR